MDTLQPSKNSSQSIQCKEDQQSNSSKQLIIEDQSYTKRQKIIRAVLDSFLRGCLLGNLIDIYRQKESELQDEVFKQIIAGDLKQVLKQFGSQQKYDITWHYLFFAEIYSLLEYDPILSPEPLNFSVYMKYILVMYNLSNNNIKQQLQSIMPQNITIPQNETPCGSDKYKQSLQLWIQNNNQIKEGIFKQFDNKIICLKFTLSQIIPLLFIYSTNSLKLPVEKVRAYIKNFGFEEEQQAALIFYFVFMNKLLKYYLKENSIIKAINKIKTKLKGKKSYLDNKEKEVLLQCEKKIEILKKLQKDPKFINISQSSQQTLLDDYSVKVQLIKYDQSYKNFQSLLVDVIVQLIAYIGILDHDSIIFKIQKLNYEQSSIPALLLSFPVLAIGYPDNYINQLNDLIYRTSNQDCLLNYLNPDPWFSTQISNQIFTEFVNLFCEKFYRNSK
ncbi:hypothetical protein TTHERM_00295200 (macronuclear) [Tetrahymena thermophila SB210]|uniref:Uncharacterized protein n=1 Tax=Tetrahymena thermophila (strain SB210) TaxID=312017 RepID=I7M0X8_TETTS|nr:hypothetical protein TTHERM_00295200 [Tetrahymena thermophila SB210]EAR92907.2 hypothetical protein TTHERM_00295200 [Tetrahymena thermophila SB210]|eukprot:XP_001013152.2 hypothetical protein TTHERM_00295200 [Tetrahymena thermophila SB210]